MEKNDWLKKVAASSGEKIQNSTVFLSIFTKNFVESAHCLLELGIAIILDKPIILIVCDDVEVPKNLERIAVVQRIKDNSELEMQRATEAAIKKLEEREREYGNIF